MFKNKNIKIADRIEIINIVLGRFLNQVCFEKVTVGLSCKCYLTNLLISSSGATRELLKLMNMDTFLE